MGTIESLTEDERKKALEGWAAALMEVLHSFTARFEQLEERIRRMEEK